MSDICGLQHEPDLLGAGRQACEARTSAAPGSVSTIDRVLGSKLNRIDPREYPRRVLLVVSGMSPQILTETLHALVNPQVGNGFVPTEIHLITTRPGARQARLCLLRGDAYFLRLCSEYGLDDTIFGESSIHVISDAEGRPLDDIRTPAQNEVTADFITAMIGQLTADETVALHVSMAGGRKTMGYYAGYALSLYGRAQDRLSHVLVSEGYENLSNFYYPTTRSQTIYDRGGRALDAADAEVSLAEIPFVRMRNGIPPRLLDGRASFNEAINLAQKADQPPRLDIDVDNRTLVCSGERVLMPSILFAFYVWLVQRESPVSRREMDDTHAALELARELLSTYQTIEGAMRDTDRTGESLLRYGVDKNYFEEKKSRIGRILREQLGAALAHHYEIRKFGSYGASQYGLALEPEQVQWLTQENRGKA